MPFLYKTRKRMRREHAFLASLNVARYSALAAFDPSPVTLRQFDSLKAPFGSRSAQRFARSVCEAIATEARIDTANLLTEQLFVVCSIAVHRHRLKLCDPPEYHATATEARHALECGTAI